MTYSIVARDAESGQLGVAAQSCYFALGAVLPWARAGVGAVATQSMVNPSYGPLCLDLMQGGATAAEALAQVRADDEGRDVRQVGVVSAGGDVASFTGSDCISVVGHAEGAGFSAQANMMARDGVCQAMAAAYESSTGGLAHRLVAALFAAEDQGGDARGQMSAALLVVEGEHASHPWDGVVVDVRVDHHPDPLTELARLATVAEAYRLCDIAEAALVTGDIERALAGTEAGLALLPHEGNLLLSHIAALAALGRTEEAAAEVRSLVAERPTWEGVLRSFAQRGFLPLPGTVTIDELLS